MFKENQIIRATSSKSSGLERSFHSLYDLFNIPDALEIIEKEGDYQVALCNGFGWNLFKSDACRNDYDRYYFNQI